MLSEAEAEEIEALEKERSQISDEYNSIAKKYVKVVNGFHKQFGIKAARLAEINQRIKEIKHPEEEDE